jgi:hypothetical protein
VVGSQLVVQCSNCRSVFRIPASAFSTPTGLAEESCPDCEEICVFERGDVFGPETCPCGAEIGPMGHLSLCTCPTEDSAPVQGSEPELVTTESDPELVNRFYRAAWFQVAQVIVGTGHDCTVLDPDALSDETFFDGDSHHGTIQVRTHVGLGWNIIVSECEPDVEDD